MIDIILRFGLLDPWTLMEQNKMAYRTTNCCKAANLSNGDFHNINCPWYESKPMTREEAIALTRDKLTFVDMAEALGLLKFEEKEKPYYLVVDVNLNGHNSPNRISVKTSEIEEVLARCGYKIIKA